MDVEIGTSLPVSGKRFLSWNRLLLQGKEHWEHLDMGVFRREDPYKYIFPWNHFRYCVILVGCTNPFLYVFMVVSLTAKYQLNHCEISKSTQWIFWMQNLRKNWIEMRYVKMAVLNQFTFTEQPCCSMYFRNVQRFNICFIVLLKKKVIWWWLK